MCALGTHCRITEWRQSKDQFEKSPCWIYLVEIARLGIGTIKISLGRKPIIRAVAALIPLYDL